MDKKSLQKLIDEKGIQYIDFRFTDPLGTWHHFSVHINTFEMDVFEEGIGFDGSSIRCFQSIEASDMILIPDAGTAFVDPFFTDPTLVLICDIQDPITGQKYDKDPRYVAKKAEEYVKSSLMILRILLLFLQHTLGPVSYTHLTLPTILLV